MCNLAPTHTVTYNDNTFTYDKGAENEKSKQKTNESNVFHSTLRMSTRLLTRGW